MMHYKEKNFSFINKFLLFLTLIFVTTITAQEPVLVEVTDSTKIDSVKIDSIKPQPFQRIKVDGVSAVVGDYVILESDIDKTYLDLKNQGISTKEISRCQLLGKLMEDKLYAHQATQDSIIVSDIEIRESVQRQIDYFVAQVGSIQKVLKLYNKTDEQSLRTELFEINKVQQLSQKMQTKIVDEIEITPEEVRQWFKKIPKEQLPVFGAELEIAQIVIKPKPPEAAIQKTINQLKQFKKEVEEDGVSFGTKAILYSQYPGSRSRGGFYSLNKKSPMVKEFKDVAFNLQEGEVSEPFETDFGWHIVTVDKIRGQELDVRHILLIPEIPSEAVEKAKDELNLIRQRILDDEITFKEAAKEFSDEKETKFDGGVLRNPATLDTRFELTKMDPTLYNQVRNLKDDEISLPLLEEDRGGTKYKILKITNRYDEHTADYAKDYVKIKELALKEKQFNTIKNWMNEKIMDTYISLNSDNKNCDFSNNWFKK